MRVLLGVLLLVYAIVAFQPPTIDVNDHFVQDHASIGRFVELMEHDTLVLKCHGRFDDLKYTFPNLNEHRGYNESGFEDRVEETIDEAFGDTMLTINDVRESDTGTYSCISMEHPSLNDTLHVFVYGSRVFLPLTSVMIMYNEGEVMVPCKTTKFVDKNDIELYANEVLVKAASKNYDQRYGYKITKKLYDVKPIQGVKFECRHKKEPRQDVDYIISENVRSSNTDNDFNFYWSNGHEWPYVGYNYTLICNLAYNGTQEFKAYENNLHIECPQCSNVAGSHVYVERNKKANENRLVAKLHIAHLELEDTGSYKCIWKNEYTDDKFIEYHLSNISPTRSQIKILERSPQILRIKEGRSTALSAKFAVFPADEDSYTATWSRMYNSSIKDGAQSETIITDETRTISAEDLKNGVFTETLNLGSGSVTTSMSGTYRLSISHINSSHSVQWEVAIENDEPDVQITVREPSSFIVFNQQFYPPDTHLHIDCISISIPPADVVFERKDTETGEFQAIDSSLLIEVGGTYEKGFIWNMTLTEDVELRCVSEKHGKKHITKKSIIVADEALKVNSKITKSKKATKSEEEDNAIYEGDHVRLTCVVPTGAVDWDVSWRFEGNDLPSSETKVKGHSKHVTLQIEDITTSSSGKYFCVVKKGDSEELLEAVVKVESISKPHHTDADSQSIVAVNYDETFVINCNMAGKPAAEFTWFKNGNPYTHGEQIGSLLKVTRARAEDDGQFHCLATNRAGATSNYIEVKVDGVPKGSSFLYWFFVFIVFLAVVAICFLVYKVSSWKKLAKQKDITLNELYNMIEHNAGPLPEEMKALPIEERTYYLPYNTNYEIDPVNLELLEPLGSGHFGVVKKGYLQMADPKSQIEYKTRLPVAVKSSTNPYNVELQRMMAEELKIMCAIPKHPNVLALVGAVTANMRKGQLFIVTEYIDGGSLKDYLFNHRAFFKNELIEEEEIPVDDSYMVPNSVKKKKYKFEDDSEASERLLSGETNYLCTSDLLSIGLQIANGMEWLANVPCVHRDLACRNVLITKTKIVRIADFGLAKRHTNKNYYRTKKSKDTPLPVRWLPEESFDLFKFNEKSDVWSFGICLYEIFTLGGTPYPGMDNLSVVKFVREGHRNTQPEYCHDDIFELMKKCWQESPNDRPTFSECIQHFKNHMEGCASSLIDRIDNMLHMEREEQLKLEEWTQKSRPDIPGARFKKSPKKQAAEERYLIVESHA
ncbi:CRE-VER-3 protein [Caenorhabditis remanei]|uniref:receptor protein-tyrosine kinase n=1 Tax=Caenorhabditis remanei TaxID=31234 RepID=E3M2I4_CAERE|nr:CRE-VER-3 protein [Caenorhabditis remanei]